MSQFLSNGKNSYFTEDTHLIWSQSYTQDSSLVRRKAKKVDKLLSTPWMRSKKNSKVTYRSQEKYTTRLSGSTLKTPSSGFIWPRPKKRDWRFCRQDLTPSSLEIQCRLTASKKWYPRKARRLLPTTLYTSTSSKNNSKKCLESASEATAGARHFWELRGTVAWETPRWSQQWLRRERMERCCERRGFFSSRSQGSRSMTRWSIKRPGKDDQISRNQMNHHWFGEERNIQYFQQLTQKKEHVNAHVVYALRVRQNRPKKILRSIWDYVCFIPFRERRRLSRSETRKEEDVSMTIGEQKTRQEAYWGEITALFCIDEVEIRWDDALTAGPPG